MQGNLINKIHPFIRFCCFVIISIMLLISKSLYLTLFLTTLIFLLALKSDTFIYEYIKKIYLYKVLLIIIFALVIYLFKIFNIFKIALTLYKILLIFTLINIFILNSSFEDINLLFYYILKPLNRLKINIEKLSFDLTISLYFIKEIFSSKNHINKLKNQFYKKNSLIIDTISSRMIYSINEISKFEHSLKMSYYKINKIRIDLKSKIVFIIFNLLFIISIIREVII